jgi:hypothetical protein
MNQSANADCIFIAQPVKSIRIVNNNITSLNNVIFDTGAPGLLVEGNKLTGLNGGNVAARTYAGTPNNAVLKNNIHISTANNIRVSSGTLSIDNEKFIGGFHDYGSATVKDITRN